MSAIESYNKIFELMKSHHDWFANSIPLIASENIPRYSSKRGNNI